MKYILPVLVIALSGCTTATNYTQAEKDANEGHAPKMFLGVLKVYPQAALKIATTPMILTPTCSSHRSISYTQINTNITVKELVLKNSIDHTYGCDSTTTYTTKGYIR